jgi:hypothetical protein
MSVLGKSTQDKKIVLAIGLRAKSVFWKFNNWQSPFGASCP